MVGWDQVCFSLIASSFGFCSARNRWPPSFLGKSEDLLHPRFFPSFEHLNTVLAYWVIAGLNISFLIVQVFHQLCCRHAWPWARSSSSPWPGFWTAGDGCAFMSLIVAEIIPYRNSRNHFCQSTSHQDPGFQRGASCISQGFPVHNATLTKGLEPAGFSWDVYVPQPPHTQTLRKVLCVFLKSVYFSAKCLSWHFRLKFHKLASEVLWCR